MKRILVLGCGGSGKSTLALKSGAVLGLPVVHLDRFFWKKGWVPISHEQFLQSVSDQVSEEQWVMDGNYFNTFESRLDRADTIIFCDLPVWVCLWRVLKRRICFHGTNRPDITEGCNERLEPGFLFWILGYRRTDRPEVLRRLEIAQQRQKQVIHLDSTAAVKRFEETLGTAI